MGAECSCDPQFLQPGKAQALNPEPVDELMLGSDLPFVLKAGLVIGAWQFARPSFDRREHCPQQCCSCNPPAAIPVGDVM